MTLMKLKLAENKWNLEKRNRQFLEEENEKLRAKIAVAGRVQRRVVCQEEESGKGKVVFYVLFLCGLWSLHCPNSQKSRWRHS